MYEEIAQRAKAATTLVDAAAVLSELLTGGYSVWEDGSLYSIKQLVERVKGFRIEIYPNEHPPPHFHVIGADVSASFTIEGCALMHGNISGREQNLVRWWHQHSRQLLIEVWNTTRPSNCQVGPILD